MGYKSAPLTHPYSIKLCPLALSLTVYHHNAYNKAISASLIAGQKMRALRASFLLGALLCAVGAHGDPLDNTGFLFNQLDFKLLLHDYPVDGVEIGQGWDSFLNRKAIGTCIDAQHHVLIGSNLDLKFSQVDDREHLFNSLNVSASASYGGGAFSASGSVSFAKSSTIDSSKLNLLAIERIDTGGVYIM